MVIPRTKLTPPRLLWGLPFLLIHGSQGYLLFIRGGGRLLRGSALVFREAVTASGELPELSFPLLRGGDGYPSH